MTPADNNSQATLKTLNRAILIGFIAIGLVLVFWSVLRVGILTREDNPRLVEAEFHIQRGQILDRNNVILAENIGPPERQQRYYPLPQIGPAVGYYSFRHGTAGIEESYDTVLRGDGDQFWADWVRQTLHRPHVGQDVQLTLIAPVQRVADNWLGNHAGAILLLELNDDSANILALVSHPQYDPNQLDELFDELTTDETAPLLNRVTQGQYQPGLIVQPFILAAALDQGIISLNDTVENANRPVPINGIGTRCDGEPPETVTWADVLAYHCPGPMQDLADQLGVTELDQIFADYGLTIPPQFALDTEAPESEPLTDPLLAGIGQENLTVTPLQVGLAMATLAGNGHLPTPRLVATQSISQSASQPVSPSARAVRNALPRFQSISEYNRLVISGPEGSTNSWYLGLTNDYVVVVVVEEINELKLAEGIGRGVITAVSFAESNDN